MKKLLSILLIISLTLLSGISVSCAELMDRNTFLALFMASTYIGGNGFSASPVKEGYFMLAGNDESLMILVNSDLQIVGFYGPYESVGLIMYTLGCLDRGYSESTESWANDLLPRSDRKKEIMLNGIAMDILTSGMTRFNTARDSWGETYEFSDDLFDYSLSLADDNRVFFIVDVKEAMAGES